MTRHIRKRTYPSDPADWSSDAIEESEYFQRGERIKELSSEDSYYLVPPNEELPPAKPVRQGRRQHPKNAHRLRQNSSSIDYADVIPPLPRLGRRRGIGGIISFIVLVILPTVIAAFYYLAIASPQYVSEFRFSVKDTSASANSGTADMLAILGNSAAGANTENYLVVDYLTSRQAVEDLLKDIRLIDLYARSEIDFWSRFDNSQPIEQFIYYWRKMVTAQYDQVTGIATAQIRAFTPQDAFSVANALVALSEELINRISIRTRTDAVRFAEGEVEKAQDRLRRILTTLIERNTGKLPANPADLEANTPLLLDMERQAAQNILASTMQTLEQARANAATQHLYITPYVRPSLPQSPAYPRVFVSVLVVGAIAFAIWLAGLLIGRSIFERFS